MIQIQVRNIFEGMHCYPDAPEEVSFLRAMHRHQFVVYTTIEVFDDDRELEFILVKREIQNYVLTSFGRDGIIDLQTRSCEWLAKEICSFIHQKYGYTRAVSVGVFEDDENGAIVTE